MATDQVQKPGPEYAGWEIVFLAVLLFAFGFASFCFSPIFPQSMAQLQLIGFFSFCLSFLLFVIGVRIKMEKIKELDAHKKMLKRQLEEKRKRSESRTADM